MKIAPFTVASIGGMLLLPLSALASAIPQPNSLIERGPCYRYAFESKYDGTVGPNSNCCCAGSSCTVSWGYSQTFILSGEALNNADRVAASYQPYAMTVINRGAC